MRYGPNLRGRRLAEAGGADSRATGGLERQASQWHVDGAALRTTALQDRAVRIARPGSAEARRRKCAYIDRRRFAPDNLRNRLRHDRPGRHAEMRVPPRRDSSGRRNWPCSSGTRRHRRDIGASRAFCLQVPPAPGARALWRYVPAFVCANPTHIPHVGHEWNSCTAQGIPCGCLIENAIIQSSTNTISKPERPSRRLCVRGSKAGHEAEQTWADSKARRPWSRAAPAA